MFKASAVLCPWLTLVDPPKQLWASPGTSRHGGKEGLDCKKVDGTWEIIFIMF